jgi:Large ribosomal RNA subunit accumulation protein YceD
MPEPQKNTPPAWHVPLALEAVPEEGRRVELVAEADTRAAVAKIAGLRGLPRLQADFDVRRHAAEGLRVVGRVSATVDQTCVVTLEPLTNEVVEEIDLVFVPGAAKKQAEGETRGETKSGSKGGSKGEMKDQEEELTADEDQTEPLIGGSVDLGAIATEFLILGLDPYPRKPGVVFQPPQQTASGDGPFAALAALKKDGDAP